jgi:hypothetical protein
MVAAEPNRARIVFVEADTAGPAAEERYAELARRAGSILREGRSLGAGGPELPASFEDATVAGLAWLIQQTLVAEDPADAARLLPELETIGIEPYRERAA